MPGHTDHETAVVTPVGGPPLLTVSHESVEIFLERLEIELLNFLAVVEARAHRVGLGIMLVQDVEVQRLRPPFHIGHAGLCRTAMHHRTFTFAHCLSLLQGGAPSRHRTGGSRGAGRHARNFAINSVHEIRRGRDESQCFLELL